MPGNQLTLGSARLDRKRGGSCVAPGDRLQPQKSQIHDFFFNPSSQREVFRIYVFSYAYI